MYGVLLRRPDYGADVAAPAPGVEAISEQASPVDQWMNDDDHRLTGALRESYDFNMR